MLSAEQPEQNAEHYSDDDAGDQEEIERRLTALDHHITRLSLPKIKSVRIDGAAHQEDWPRFDAPGALNDPANRRILA